MSLRLGWHPVLHDLSLDLHRGRHLAVLGGNGSGKTSLLRLIAGELWPTPPADGGLAGVRRYDFGHGPEEDALGARTHIRLIGPELHDEAVARMATQTGWQVVGSGFDAGPLLRRRLSPDERRQVDKCLLRTAARRLADLPFGSLSRGEQRRLLIARALVTGPLVLCLDEVGDGLDTGALDRLRSLLVRLAGQGVTLVMATHDPGELPELDFDRVHLEGGRIVAPEVPVATPGAGVSPRSPRGVRVPAGAPLIEMHGANVYRGGRRVLRDLDWALHPGERWLVRGANGAGKSTFIKLLHAELRPARGGSIRWFDLPDPPDVWAVRSRIGLVSDELQALQRIALDVRACVATGFASSIGRVPPLDAAQEAAIAEWLDRLGLTSLATRPVNRLSHGQLRRVMLARALVKDPMVLLLDEPATGLDARSRGLFRRVLAEAAEAGKGIVMAAHRTGLGPEGDGLFNRHAMVSGGRLVLGDGERVP